MKRSLALICSLILFVVAFPIQGCENIPSKQEIERLTKAIEQLGTEAEQLRGEIKQLKGEIEQLRAAAKPLTDIIAAFGKASPNSSAEADLRNAATEQEAYYVDHSRYTNNLKELEQGGFRRSPGVTTEILEANKNHYSMQSYHKDGDRVYHIRGPKGSVESRPKKGE